MRLIPVFVVAVLCAAPPFAQASVRMHMPHKHHRAHGSDASAGPAAAPSGVPDPFWTSANTRR